MFAETTIRSLIIIFYRFLEDCAYKYNNELSPLSTTLNSSKKTFDRLDTKKIKDSIFCPFCTANHYEILKNLILKWEKMEKLCTSKYEIPFSKSYKAQFTLDDYEKLETASRKPSVHTKRMDRLKINLVSFILKTYQRDSAMESFTKELSSNAYAEQIPKETLSFFKTLRPEQLNLGGQVEVEILGKAYPSI